MRAALLPLAILLVGAFLQPAAADGAETTISPLVYFRPDTATQGFYSFGSTFYCLTFTRDTTAKLDRFTSGRFGADTWGNIGFASDTPSTNMTVTLIQNYDLEYTTTGAGVQRVYATGIAPPTVTSGGTGVWDGSTSTMTVTTAGASTVHLRWDVASYNSYESAKVLSSVIPLIAIFTVFALLKNPGEWRVIISVGVAVAILAFFGYLFALWGA
jgi:hypothetical protein